MAIVELSAICANAWSPYVESFARSLTENETLTGVKPQTHQSGRILSLADILAAGSLIIVDMAQMPTTFERSLQMEFNTYLSHSGGFACFNENI